LKIKYKNLKKSVKVKLPDVNAKPWVTGGGLATPLESVS
jgi:hypothetical protein